MTVIEGAGVAWNADGVSVTRTDGAFVPTLPNIIVGANVVCPAEGFGVARFHDGPSVRRMDEGLDVP